MEEKSVKPELPILLFDSECPLCVRFKDSLMRIEDAKKITAISINDDSIYDHYPMLNKEECERVVHYITKDEKVLKGEEVISHLAKLFPLVNKFSWLIESDMGQKVTKYFHNRTSAYRKYVKRKCPSCSKHL